jgi:hypothetical protein
MSSDFFSNGYRPEDPESDIFSLTKEFTVVVTVVLSWDTSRKFEKEVFRQFTDVDKSGWTQKQVIFLHLF